MIDPDEDTTEESFSLDETAAYLGISKDSVRTLISQGKLPERRQATSHGGRIRGTHCFLKSDLDAYREQHPTSRNNGRKKRPQKRRTGTRESESSLMAQVLVSLFNEAGRDIRTVTSIEEIAPEIRMWRIQAAGEQDTTTYHVLYDGGQFSVRRIAEDETEGTV